MSHTVLKFMSWDPSCFVLDPICYRSMGWVAIQYELWQQLPGSPNNASPINMCTHLQSQSPKGSLCIVACIRIIMPYWLPYISLKYPWQVSISQPKQSEHYCESVLLYILGNPIWEGGCFFPGRNEKLVAWPEMWVSSFVWLMYHVRVGTMPFSSSPLFHFIFSPPSPVLTSHTDGNMI